ncbi:hypothetical protein [Raoultella ornithinolytica]|uniref:hypothetical protein n=1 Tax=Raoultella ornithinolytica TaxID=54291 RepID=UPI00292BB23F|nr:hypothetical protein [Raoultella ornithinolytica]MDV1096686.1 hypothetical protein [Raoultella ornithinolytica]
MRSDCPAKRRASRSNPPVALRLPGLQGVRSDCPAKRRASRSNPSVALRLPGLQGRAVGLPG